MRKTYKIIGLMSGTSMDGLDIAYIELTQASELKWDFKLIESETALISDKMKAKLNSAKQLSGYELQLLDLSFGEYIATSVLDFIQAKNIDKSKVDAIASHGFTVFHQPHQKLTLQIGNGELIAQKTGINTINNFREKDVMHGGQGAPLVPIGDLLLFNDEADAFLNLGGFANATFIQNNEIQQAYDISPCNLPLNFFANKLGKDYDKNGELGKNVTSIDQSILEKLNNLAFYSQSAPKSLGTEWLETNFFSILNDSKARDKIKLKTCYEHISLQIANNVNHSNAKKVFVTGGGAKNSYLIDLIKQNAKADIIIPNEAIIDYKEAIVFALLGALHLENSSNCLSVVTGASKNVCGGVMHLA